MNEKVPRKKKRSLKKLLKHKTFRMRNIFSVISLLLIIIMLISFISVKVLPGKVVIITPIIAIILWMIGVYCINIHRKVPVKVIGGVILAVVSCLSILGLYVSHSTETYFKNSFSTKKNTYHQNVYYLIGLRTSENNKPTAGEKVGVYENMYNLAGAFEKLDKTYELTHAGYADIYEMFTAMNQGAIKYILIDKTEYEAFFRVMPPELKNNYEIINEFDVYSNNTKTNSLNTEKFNLLVRNSDISGISNINLLLTIDTKERNALITIMPRETYLLVSGLQKGEKLQYLNIYGKTIAERSIATTLETDIDYTLTINDETFASFIDSLDGIEYCTENRIDLSEELKIVKGCNNLTGEMTVQVANYNNNELLIDNLSNIIEGIVNKFKDQVSINNYTDILNTLDKVYETDLSEKVVINILKDLLANKDEWEVESQVLTGELVPAPTVTAYTYDTVLAVNPENLQEVQNKINEALN